MHIWSLVYRFIFSPGQLQITDLIIGSGRSFPLTDVRNLWVIPALYIGASWGQRARYCIVVIEINRQCCCCCACACCSWNAIVPAPFVWWTCAWFTSGLFLCLFQCLLLRRSCGPQDVLSRMSGLVFTYWVYSHLVGKPFFVTAFIVVKLARHILDGRQCSVMLV